MRLDGDEMPADADDADAGHASGTYISAGRLSTPAEVGDILADVTEVPRVIGVFDPYSLISGGRRSQAMVQDGNNADRGDR